jgi:hypothetical protein
MLSLAVFREEMVVFVEGVDVTKENELIRGYICDYNSISCI